jgi:hypothetical protein
MNFMKRKMGNISQKMQRLNSPLMEQFIQILRIQATPQRKGKHFPE